MYQRTASHTTEEREACLLAMHQSRPQRRAFRQCIREQPLTPQRRGRPAFWQCTRVDHRGEPSGNASENSSSHHRGEGGPPSGNAPEDSLSDHRGEGGPPSGNVPENSFSDPRGERILLSANEAQSTAKPGLRDS